MNQVATMVPIALLALCAQTALADTQQEAANKKIVIEFYDEAINQKDFEAAGEYLGARANPEGPDDRGSAVMDIFRVENGKVVEHWDVAQPIPEESNNDNGMF